ncbi:MAG: hypothetical protein QM831_00225 [Kofleriaceae bacterium]
MDETEIIARYGLPPRDEDLPAIRDHLDTYRDDDTTILKAYAVLLFAAGHVEDAPRIWRAKRSSFDASMSLDVQLLCGAGYAESVEYLASAEPDAHAYILHCTDTGDFTDFTPAQRLADYRRYYGLHM